MLARQIRRPRPGLVLLQHPDDLVFREPCSLHPSVLQEGRTLNPHGGESQWQVIFIPFYPLPYREKRGGILFPASGYGWHVRDDVLAAIAWLERFVPEFPRSRKSADKITRFDVEEAWIFVPR